MASYVRIENAIHPSITLGAIRIIFRNLQGLSKVPSAITAVPPKSNNLQNFGKKSKKVLNMSIIEYRKEGLKKKRFRHIPTSENVPTRLEPFWHVSNTTDTFRTVSKRSNTFQHVWKRSDTSRTVLTRFELFRNVATRLKTFRHVSNRSDTFRTVSKRSNTFRHVWKRSDTS